jgi:RNA polymerase sigma-70 factor (ECF subfamily)
MLSMSTTNAVEDAYIRYRGDVYRFLLRRTGSHSDADELTQQVFADALSALSRRPPRSMRAWLFAVAERRRIDELRRRGRAAEVAAALVPASDHGMIETPGVVEDALRALPARQRRIVVMRIIEDRTFGEIARDVGCDEAACRMGLSRALRRLRDDLRIAS